MSCIPGARSALTPKKHYKKDPTKVLIHIEKRGEKKVRVRQYHGRAH